MLYILYVERGKHTNTKIETFLFDYICSVYYVFCLSWKEIPFPNTSDGLSAYYILLVATGS